MRRRGQQQRKLGVIRTQCTNAILDDHATPARVMLKVKRAACRRTSFPEIEGQAFGKNASHLLGLDTGTVAR